MPCSNSRLNHPALNPNKDYGSVTINGITYPTIVIGDLEWMAVNLDGVFGSSMQLATNSTQLNSNTSVPKAAYYNFGSNEEFDCGIGLFYDSACIPIINTWLSSNNLGQWRVPTAADFQNLYTTYNLTSPINALNNFASTNVDYWTTNLYPGANNSSGFSLVGSGFYDSNTDTFVFKGEISTSLGVGTSLRGIGVSNSPTQVGNMAYYNTSSGPLYPVRLVKNVSQATAICVTLTNCITQQYVYYYAENAADISLITALSQGQLIEITDSIRFPDRYYVFQNYCIPTAPECSCATQTTKIVDPNGESLPFWSISSQLICPNLNVNNDVYLLTNCLANIATPNVDTFVNNPAFGLFTSTDLSLYVDMIVNISGQDDLCFKVSGPFAPGEGASLRPTVTITNAYSTCECCLPPPPPPGCCEIPKYTQKPVKDFFRITVSEENIKANTSFANNYYKLYMGMRYGVNSCCTGIDYDKLWIDKEIIDLENIKYSTCTAILPTLCLYVTGNDPCGSQVATYNDFINGKWSFKFTRDTGVNVIIYWDNQNSYWVIKNEDTGVIGAKLPINSNYPIGTNTQWLVVNKAACISPDCGLSTWSVDCSYYDADPCNNCDKPQNAVAE